MVLPTMVMDMVMVLPTTDTMDTHMLTMDTIMARDPLMLRLMPMLTTDTTHMLMDTTDMDTMLMDMPTMDTMDTHMLMVTTDSRLLEEALQRQALPWTLPLQGTIQDLLAHRPWHDPPQDRAWQGRSEEAADLRGCAPSL